MEAQINIFKNLDNNKIFIDLSTEEIFDSIKYQLHLDDQLIEIKESKLNTKDVTFLVKNPGKYCCKTIAIKDGKEHKIDSKLIEISDVKPQRKLRQAVNTSLNICMDGGEDEKYYILVKYKNSNKKELSELLGSVLSGIEYSIDAIFDNKYLEKVELNHGDASCVNLFQIDLTCSNNEKLEFTKEIDQLKGIDWAYLRYNTLFDASMDEGEVGRDFPFPSNPTPDLQDHQRYLDDFPGMNCKKAWSRSRGKGSTVFHYDAGYNMNHEEFSGRRNLHILGYHSNENHGTSSLGIMAANNDGKGMTGIASESEYYLSNMPTNISEVVKQAKAGDIVSVDQQDYAAPHHVPVDHDPYYLEPFKEMCNRGVIVIMAAGNGYTNLDTFKGYNNPGDYGGIKIGACDDTTSLTRCDFSNYGENVYFCSWGNWSVATTGAHQDHDKDLFNEGPNRVYRSGFAGTSSATPLCASSLAVIQGYAKTKYDTILTSYDLRDIIKKTGYKGVSANEIGSMPNLNEALNEVDRMISNK